MPSGHTDKATINQRRPLTDNMRATMHWIHIAQAKSRSLYWDQLTKAEKNAVRALLDRGMICPKALETLARVELTDAGKKALQSA